MSSIESYTVVRKKETTQARGTEEARASSLYAVIGFSR